MLDGAVGSVGPAAAGALLASAHQDGAMAGVGTAAALAGAWCEVSQASTGGGGGAGGTATLRRMSSMLSLDAHDARVSRLALWAREVDVITVHIATLALLFGQPSITLRKLARGACEAAAAWEVARAVGGFGYTSQDAASGAQLCMFLARALGWATTRWGCCRVGGVLAWWSHPPAGALACMYGFPALLRARVRHGSGR